MLAIEIAWLSLSCLYHSGSAVTALLMSGHPMKTDPSDGVAGRVAPSQTRLQNPPAPTALHFFFTT
jgi:hypothetical protein